MDAVTIIEIMNICGRNKNGWLPKTCSFRSKDTLKLLREGVCNQMVSRTIAVNCFELKLIFNDFFSVL